MSVDFSAWLGASPTNVGTPETNEATRAAAAWRRIQDKPTSIVIDRNGSDLAAQTVRLETDSGERNVIGENGITHRIDAIVFGIRNHATLVDTDILSEDRFMANDVAYEVVILAIELLGEVQAYCQVRR